MLKPRNFTYYLCLILIVGIAAYLRFVGLSDKPLWVDEAFFYFLSQETFPKQEFLPVVLAKGLSWFVELGEFWLRLPSAIAGVLLVLFVGLHEKDRLASLVVATVVATFPLFVFWSQLARPYMLGACFVAIGWRFPWFYVPAVLTTPISLIGINWLKFNYKSFKTIVLCILLIVLTVVGFLLRPDIERKWDLEFFLYAKRLWIIPLVAVCLGLLEYVFPFLKSGASEKSVE